MASNHKTKNSTGAWTVILWILAVLAILGIVLGVIIHLAPLSRDEESSKVIATPEWIVGGISDDGELTEATNTICTKGAFGCADLVIQLDADAEFTYQVFFYDDDEKFIEATEIFEESIFSFERADGVTQARILLVPTEGTEEITEEQAATMGKQLTVTVAK